MYRGSHQYNTRRSVDDPTGVPDPWGPQTAVNAGRFSLVSNEGKAMPAQKVLVADDERLVRWSLRQKCEEWGYVVIEADSGEAALRLAEREAPDLVLLDGRMDDLSGIEGLAQLRGGGGAPCVIMIPADPQLDDVKASLKLGAYDFGGKPIDFDELHLSIQDAFEAAGARNQADAPRTKTRAAGYENVVSVSPK